MSLIDIFTGLAFASAGLMLLWRQILLSPLTRSFPCAPLVVRVAMFATGVALIFLGMLFFGARTHPFAGDAATPVAVLGVGVALYHSVLLGNAFQERRPAKVWDMHARIDRLSRWRAQV